MRAGLSCEMFQSVRLSAEQKLEQKTKLKLSILSQWLQLVGDLRGEQYSPKGTCPKCHRELNPLEIIKGFNDNPNDFTTCCSGCGHRFQPILISFNGISSIEFPFFCDIQTLNKLQDKKDVCPDDLARLHPAIYRSAIVHHGNLKNAFKKISIDYLFDEIPDWRNKIKLFLGKLPDTKIAMAVNVPVSSIRNMRRKVGLPRFTAKVLLET